MEMTSDRRIYRHRLWVRVAHWVNLVCMAVLLMSGLQIFNAHPALYWGESSRFDDPILSVGAEYHADGRVSGVTTLAGQRFDTTGVLGLSGDPAVEASARAFPAWMTLPSVQSLPMGRRWHFFFAWLFAVNGAIYGITAIVGGHFRRDLVPSRTDLGHIGRSIWDHMRLRFPVGESAKRYNVLQKLAYVAVVAALGPLMILAGLAMSPRLDASFPWLLHLFSGRQSARTIHFVCAFAFLGFVLIHVAMVLLSGAWNNLRSMITGWYDVGGDHDDS
jgi:thiosulfate reductase cytochrome b subunit